MVREDPYKLPASEHSLDALNVAALRKMVTAPNAGAALPFGGPGQLWQRVAISMAADNVRTAHGTKIDGPACTQGRRAWGYSP